MQLYGDYEDEILSLPDNEYEALEKCPNCGETNENYLDRFPAKTHNRLKFNFMTMRCLSCGRYFSLSKNYEKKYLNKLDR